MLTILYHSASDKKVRDFRTFTWNSSNSLSDSLTKTYWKIDSNFGKFKFIEHLKMRSLLENLSLNEKRCLYDAPGVLTDNLYCDAFRAWQTDVPKKVLWQRLNILQSIFDKEPWSPNLYYAQKGLLRYKLEEIRSSIRKVNKYSGYVRNSSQVGSKRLSNKFIPDPESFEWTTNVEIDFYLFLSVGEFDSGIPGSAITLMRTKVKSETEINQHKDGK